MACRQHVVKPGCSGTCQRSASHTQRSHGQQRARQPRTKTRAIHAPGPSSNAVRPPHVAAASRPQAPPASHLPALLHRLDLTPAQHAQLLTSATTHVNPTSPPDDRAPLAAAANLRHLLDTYPRPHVKLLLLRHPSLLACATPLADWLAFLTSYGFTAAEVYDLLDACGPSLPHIDPYSVGQLLLTLQHHGLPPADIRTHAILKHPPLLAAPPAPLAALLATLAHLGCTPVHLRDLIFHHPRTLASASDADLRAKLRHLLHHGVTEPCVRAFLPHVVPHFLSEKQDSVAAKLQYLHSIGAHGAELERLLAACPALWSLAITDVMDKWGFLTRVMGLQLRDLLRFPGFLERDLMCCIRPRYLLLEHVLDRGPAVAAAAIDCRRIEHGDLAWLLDCSDAEYCERVGVSISQYMAFYNDLVANQYYGVKAAVDVHDRPEPRKG